MWCTCALTRVRLLLGPTARPCRKGAHPPHCLGRRECDKLDSRTVCPLKRAPPLHFVLILGCKRWHKRARLLPQQPTGRDTSLAPAPPPPPPGVTNCGVNTRLAPTAGIPIAGLGRSASSDQRGNGTAAGHASQSSGGHNCGRHTPLPC